MQRRPRAATAKVVNYNYMDSDMWVISMWYKGNTLYYCCYCKCLVFLFRSFHHAASSEEDPEEWRPPDCKHKAPTKPVGDSATVKVRAPAKRTAKHKEPKQPKTSKEPKLEVPRRATVRKTQAPKVVKDSGSELYRIDSPKMETAEENVPTIRMKEEVRELFFFSFSFCFIILLRWRLQSSTPVSSLLSLVFFFCLSWILEDVILCGRSLRGGQCRWRIFPTLAATKEGGSGRFYLWWAVSQEAEDQQRLPGATRDLTYFRITSSGG